MRKKILKTKPFQKTETVTFIMSIADFVYLKRDHFRRESEKSIVFFMVKYWSIGCTIGLVIIAF